MSMTWTKLLTRARLKGPGETKISTPQEHRSDFERDYSRVLYSTAFRRLHNKTQVYPMPENDHVHSRLTHSIEVADVGKSLGKAVGEVIVKRHRELTGFDPWDLAFVVAAGCLAHDIGNPPFGHSGELAIADFFKSGDGQPHSDTLHGCQRHDLLGFEGNAQGFRVLSKRSTRHFRGGMRLTLPSLAAFCKYPQTSVHANEDSPRKSRRKYGFFVSELSLFETVARELGLMQGGGVSDSVWCRHPLAFLTEAADDVCYRILDLEDGFTLKLVSFREFEESVQPVADVPELKMGETQDKKEKVSLLRAYAINNLVRQVSEVFIENEAAILEGKFDVALTDEIRSRDELRAIKRFAEETCYRMPEVVKAEIGGRVALQTVLSHLISAVFTNDARVAKILGEEVPSEISRYEKILRITDFVSGMTDRYAVTLYRQLQGMTLPTI